MGLGRHAEFSKTVFTYFKEQDIMEAHRERTESLYNCL